MIPTSYFIFIFIFGTIVGSFLNVVIFRYNTGRSILGLGGRLASPERSGGGLWPRGGGSFCPSCAKKLSWYELIPLLSFIIQGGKCRKCKSRISWQYPIVELTTGLVFAAIFWKFLTFNLSLNKFGIPSVIEGQLSTFNLIGLLYLILTLLIFSLLIVIAAYDIRHKIIPDKLVWFFVILALLSPLLPALRSFSEGGVVGNLGLHMLSGFLLAVPFALLWFFSKGRLMGLGDAKLSLGIGFLLGLSGGAAALILAFWTGAIISILLIIFSRLSASVLRFSSASVPRLTIKSEIPFAPFLILSTFLAFLFDIDILSIIKLFQF